MSAYQFEPLRAAASRLAAIQVEIIALSDRIDGDWRRELIGLRRRLQHEITNVAQLLERSSNVESELKQLRAALGQMRTTVALHQSNWPAVAIDRDDPGYHASVTEVRFANRKFIDLIDRLCQSNVAASPRR